MILFSFVRVSVHGDKPKPRKALPATATSEEDQASIGNTENENLVPIDHVDQANVMFEEQAVGAYGDHSTVDYEVQAVVDVANFEYEEVVGEDEDGALSGLERKFNCCVLSSEHFQKSLFWIRSGSMSLFVALLTGTLTH